MSNTIVKVENLSKSYLIGHETQGYVALRDVVSKNTKGFVKKLKLALSGKQLISGQQIEEFWALKDVSFEIKQGEAVGIIGRNGAGKSTLLKLLSRITEPTKGRIELNGRVASLLEVGTGFHPELTGRENIFLNGAILGMSRAEIKSKFDEIVDFSGVEKFLDTPVKRYSSGMYVRLAFAVAAHLEPEILIVDEVLAVGDAAFQKKCLGKMEDVSKKDGRTVLFVSHNMSAIQNLCTKAIVLNNGEIYTKGATAEAISSYLSINEKTSENNIANRKDRKGNGLIRFTDVKLFDRDTQTEIATLMSGQNVFFRLYFDKKDKKGLHSFLCAIGITNQLGDVLANLNSNTAGYTFDLSKSDASFIDICVNALPLNNGIYRLTLFSMINDEIADWVENAFEFSVEQGDFFGTGKLTDKSFGPLLINHSFRL